MFEVGDIVKRVGHLYSISDRMYVGFIGKVTSINNDGYRTWLRFHGELFGYDANGFELLFKQSDLQKVLNNLEWG